MMNVRIGAAKAARLLALIWTPAAWGYIYLAAYWDWPWPAFFNWFPDNVFATVFIIGPVAALWAGSEQLVPPGYWNDVAMERWLRGQQRKLERARRAKLKISSTIEDS